MADHREEGGQSPRTSFADKPWPTDASGGHPAPSAGAPRASVLQNMRVLAETMDQQWLTVTSSGFQADACASMAQLAHTLAGRAGSLDLPEVAELATFINTVIVSLHEEQPVLTQSEQNNVAIALKRIGEHLSHGDIVIPQPPIKAKPADTVGVKRIHRLFLVDDDEIQVEQLAVQLTAHGFRVETFNHWQTLQDRLAEGLPDAIVADISFPEGELAGIDAIGSVRAASTGQFPVVFLSVRGDTATRLAALRVGGSAYFTKPVWIPGLAAKLHELTGDDVRSPYRVLLVDDDRDVLDLHEMMLSALDFQVTTLDNPERLIEVAEKCQPEVVVLDLHMPGVSGLDLARMLRQDEAFFQIPVVFLSAEQDLHIHRQAIAEGGMDFIRKPLNQEEIAAVLASRAGLYRRMHAREEYLDRTDPVTGLYNRRYLTTYLEEQLNASTSAGRGLGILYIELDNFLPVMRCTSADELNRLRERVARTIKSHLLGDDLAACYSDPVFVVLTWRADTEALLSLAKALCADIASDEGMENRPLKLTASVGIYRVTDRDFKKALANAALACAYAHQDGGNRVYLHDDIQLQQELVDEKRRWLRQIKNALSNQRFFLVYQPITSFLNDQTHGYESFLRMLDDSDEVMLPKQFLGIVKQLGLLQTLDRWVVTHALRNLLNQQQIHSETRFFVKLSEASLSDHRFADWVVHAVQRSGVTPGTFVFQVTEKVAHAQQSVLSKFAATMSQFGCLLAVENLGDSDLWSELLGRLPIQYVKLARSITLNLHKDRKQQERFKAILEVARAEKIQVIASYVENASCLAYLYQHHVDLIQGYFLQAPDRTIGGDDGGLGGASD